MKLLYPLFIFLACGATAQIEKAKFKPYIFFGYEADSPKDHNYGAFHYTNVHMTLPPNMVGSYYQSGLFHTWYRPTEVYDQQGYDRQRDGYHCMEGGAGYKPYLRFRSKYTPQKFTTGAVAGGFGSFSNGPGQGVPSFKRTQQSPTRGWEKNLGRYGAAQLSNQLLYPLDGVGFKEGTNNEMLGYGYYTLPLTEPKDSVAGSEAPAGNRCWTLFFNTKNFSGPVCFFTPYHWAKHSIGKPHLHGKCFDSSLLKLNSIYQRETNVVPAKQWTAPNGDIYYRLTPFAMASDADDIGRLGSMPMTIDSTKWDQLEDWFEGGLPAPTSFGEVGSEIHARPNKGGRLAFTFDKVRVNSSNFAERVEDGDPSAAAFRWHGDLVEKLPRSDLVKIPEYYRQEKGKKSIEAIPEHDVPAESALSEVQFPDDVREDFNFDGFITAPLVTPLHPDYDYSDAIVDVWKTPGPVAGPFVAELSDRSQAVYYWYKFNEQPAILNSHMDAAERELMQERVELIHAHWSKDDHYFPDPAQNLAALDEGLIVVPPHGLEVGYVPICVHQQKAGEQLPDFKKVNRYRPVPKKTHYDAANRTPHTSVGTIYSAASDKPLKVYILAGQSNAVGAGMVKGVDVPGTVENCIASDQSGKYAFLTDKDGKLSEQEDVWIYFEHKGELLTGNLSVGYGVDANMVGFEISFGERIQELEQQQVLLIKTAWGGKSLAVDFRPPSAGGETGHYYKEILRLVEDALTQADQYFPSYDRSAGYEIAGLCWHQGWNDHVNKSFTKEYTNNLEHLINDLRKDLGVDFPVVVATTGMPTKRDAVNGKNSYKPIEKAQLALADTDKYSDFAGNVKIVDTKAYWKPIEESPVSSGGQHYHWNKSAEIYMDIGFGLAEAFRQLRLEN